MIKIFMAIIISSMPGWESVRYQGYIYPDLESCLLSTELYINDFKKIEEIKIFISSQLVLKLTHIL